MLAQMREREEKVKPKVSFEVGETVKVADGPFQNQSGIVEEIDPERGKLRVSVTIFRSRDSGRTRILAGGTRLRHSEFVKLLVMAKEIVAHIKLQIPAGQANPAPPVGTALGPRGVNIMAFCKEFNAATQKQAGDILPVVITVFKDKSFTFITKSPPAAVLLKKAANIAAGSKEPNKTKVGKVTRKQIMDIVKTKAKDLNSRNDEAGFKIIAGHCPADGPRSRRLRIDNPGSDSRVSRQGLRFGGVRFCRRPPGLFLHAGANRDVGRQRRADRRGALSRGRASAWFSSVCFAGASRVALPDRKCCGAS